jgi:hypothetical protein
MGPCPDSPAPVPNGKGNRQLRRKNSCIRLTGLPKESQGRFPEGSCSVDKMVSVAQLVERWIVAPVAVGSIPITHPNFSNLPATDQSLTNLVIVLVGGN